MIKELINALFPSMALAGGIGSVSIEKPSLCMNKGAGSGDKLFGRDIMYASDGYQNAVAQYPGQPVAQRFNQFIERNPDSVAAQKWNARQQAAQPSQQAPTPPPATEAEVNSPNNPRRRGSLLAGGGNYTNSATGRGSLLGN
jgi:hypothetical protein